jgi:hypothetical protein
MAFQIHELMYHNHNLRNHLDSLEKRRETHSETGLQSENITLAHTDSNVLQVTKNSRCFPWLEL